MLTMLTMMRVRVLSTAATGSMSIKTTSACTRTFTTAPVPAPAERSAHNFSFSGAGFLTSYHLGVAQGLDECGVLTSASKVAGASGGAVTALTIAAKEVGVLEMHEENKALAALSRADGTLWKLEARMRAQFDHKFRTIDLAPVNERLTIVTQRVWPAPPKIVQWSRFDSIDALGDLVIASCFIPFFLAPRGAAKIGRELFVDGGLIELTPELPGYTKTCAFPAKALRRPDYEISPSLVPDFPYNLLELAHAALVPPSSEMLDELFQLGKQSAFIWADKQRVRA